MNSELLDPFKLSKLSQLSKHLKQVEPVESVRLSPEHVLKKLKRTRCNAWGAPAL